MFFKLSNTSINFKGYTNKIFAKKFKNFIMMYLDDIFIFIKDSGHPYIETIYRVFDQLLKY